MDANTLRDNFIAEQDDIHRYVRFLSHKTAISGGNARNIISILTKYGLAQGPLPSRPFGKPVKRQKLQEFYDLLQRSSGNVSSAIEQLEAQTSPSLPDYDLYGEDTRPIIEELIQYMFDALEHDTSESAIDLARHNAIQQVHDQVMVGDADPVSEEDIDGYSFDLCW